MRIFFAWLLLVFSPSLAALAAEDLIFNPDQGMAKSTQLTGKEVQEDLELLDLALREGYEGPNFRERLSPLARERTPERLCAGLAGLLQDVNNAHLRAELNFKVCGQKPKPGQVGMNIASGFDGWVVKEIEGVTVLAVPAFWPAFDSRWNGFLERVSELRRQDRPFILDLRGNMGGDDSFGFELARILLGADPNADLPTPIAGRVFRQTPEAFALQANVWAWSELKLKIQGRPVPASMEKRRMEILNWMDRANRKEFPERYEEILNPAPLDRAKMFAKPVYVLIDRACASSCENTIQVLESLPQRILVGENTMGAVEYGETGRLILPHSKISLTLTTMSATFKDHRHPEKLGYPPDIKVQPHQDALTTAIRHIKPAPLTR